MSGRRRLSPRFTLRAKVLLVALVLALIPLVGFDFVKTIETVLRRGQEQTVAGTARAVATALHDRPQLFSLRIVPAREEDALSATPLEGGELVVTETRAAGDEIQGIVKGLARAKSRIWVVDRQLRLLAIAGSLKTDRPPRSDETGADWREIVLAPLRPLLERLLRHPSEDFDDALPENAIAGGREVASALAGVPATRWRNTPDGKAVIVAAAQPVWVGEQVVAVVVAEETANAIQALSNEALESLVAATLVASLIGTFALLFFASRLSLRLRRLRDEAEAAIDSQGRVRSLLTASAAGDEIGDLSRSFSTALERLAQYNAHLEAMASRLSHELRTPIAVVRSSLDNLRMQPLGDDSRVYIDRANEGLRRLSTLLTRMSEATRLEQTIREAERERFDAREVMAGCAAGYASAYPTHRFETRLADEPVPLEGSPDLFAQMLDKLAENAVDFSPRDEPIVLALTRAGGDAVISITNRGPLLPAELAGSLFESMVSARRDASEAPHLGLGLYVVRLIAEYHGGTVSAANLADGRGVMFTIVLPIAAGEHFRPG